MVRKAGPRRPTGQTILVVDDDRDYLESTRLLLEREGHEVVAALAGREALDFLRQRHVDLALLDYHMPQMTGAEVVTELRRFAPDLQVILTTGYASEHPPRELLANMDIQGYFDKSEGPEKLLLWVDVGLKAAQTLQLLNKNRLGLRYILEVTPELHRIQPLDVLLQGILLQVSGLLGAVNSFLAVVSDGAATRPRADLEAFVTMWGEESDLLLHASTGRFARFEKVSECLDPARIEWMRESLQQGEVRISEGASVVPLRMGDQTLGAIYLDRPAIHPEDLEILRLFANQAAAGISNVQLYEMATMDPLTGTFVRRVFEQWLLRELRKAYRSRLPLSLLVVDIDGLKRINDEQGHLAGDQALSLFGKLLKSATRGGDIIARYGGDEFCVLLPETSTAGAEKVTERVLQSLATKSGNQWAGGGPLRCSLGMVTLAPHRFETSPGSSPEPAISFPALATRLIARADQVMYRAKRAGGNRAEHAEVIEWGTPPEASSRSSAPAERPS